MTRDLERLTELSFDVLVIGGGIHGLFAAYDAALRGLSVALIDRGDFGGGATFNHQRTLHGGLRALQHGRLLKCVEQIAERRVWARIAPHLVRPLPFLIGTYRGTHRSRTMMRMGLSLYDMLGRRRNRGVPQELHLPKSRLQSASTTRRLFPGVSEAGLSGGAIWYDYQTIHPDRLTWCVALAAASSGAVLCNYVEATPDGAPMAGGHVSARDVITGRQVTINTSKVLLAAGPGLPALHRAFGLPDVPPMVRAVNLLLHRPARDIALAAASPHGRMYTAVPWQGRVLVGTFQTEAATTSLDDSVSAADIERYLEDINTTFPTLAVRREDIAFVHAGLLPGIEGQGTATLRSEPQVLAHGVSPHIVTVIGVKYTTARLVAERAVDALTGSRGDGRTSATQLPHAEAADCDGLLAETLRRLGRTLDPHVTCHLASWYGTECAAVAEASAGGTGLERLSPETPVLCGEITYAAQHSAAVRLSDIVFRRTPLASAGWPGGTSLERAADLAADALGWSPNRRDEELALVQERLRGPGH